MNITRYCIYTNQIDQLQVFLQLSAVYRVYVCRKCRKLIDSKCSFYLAKVAVLP